MRDGELGISFIYQLASLRHSKLVQANPSSSSSVIREQDLNLALLRASVGTASATNPALEQMRFVLEKGPVRALMPSLLASKGTSRVVRQEEQEEDEADESTTKKLGLSSSIFSPHLLGTPLHLTSTISWPLDLFLTPPALAAYSNIFAFLSALRKTHARVKQTWSSLSGAQRSRRKWTKTGEGGLEEGESRKSLARAGWGVVRLMLWFMDVLLAHFQVSSLRRSL
jgi:gamma-tubulin complex component 4